MSRTARSINWTLMAALLLLLFLLLVLSRCYPTVLLPESGPVSCAETVSLPHAV